MGRCETFRSLKPQAGSDTKLSVDYPNERTRALENVSYTAYFARTTLRAPVRSGRNRRCSSAQQRLNAGYSTSNSIAGIPGTNSQLICSGPVQDRFTQRSSMSATQENPRYLYDQFDMQQVIREGCPSTATPNDGSESEDQGPEPPIHDPRHASASTAHTYQENETGHIYLGFDTEPIEEEPLEESQDASYAMPVPAVQPSYSSFEPKTPAPPVNPFRQKGSVMKGFELFGATQPSSIGRHMVATPTSSRPSPDVYNDFSSPPKRHTPILSSPLRRGPPEPESEINDATPLQSSVRNMLGRSQSPRMAQSFDTGPKSTWANSEPRPYVSMQESQEKRRRTIEPDFDSSCDDSDMETPRNHNRKTERELQIQKELARVELRKRTPSRNPRSSAPPSSTAAVEVPSTGRRRIMSAS